MIRGLADAGRCLKKPEYTKAAERAADFVLANLRRDGRLLRTHTAGRPSSTPTWKTMSSWSMA